MRNEAFVGSLRSATASMTSAGVLEAPIRADLIAAKAGIMKLTTAHGVSVGTVQRIKAVDDGPTVGWRAIGFWSP